MAGNDVGKEFSDERFRLSKCIRFGLGIVVLSFLLGSMSRSAGTGPVAVYMGLVAALMAFLAIGLVRAFVVGIRLTEEGVEVRTTYATKRLAWDTIVRARAQDRSVRTSPFALGLPKTKNDERTKVYAVLDLEGGRDARLYGLQIVANDFADSEWIDEAVMAINRVVAAKRGLPDPSVATRPR